MSSAKKKQQMGAASKTSKPSTTSKTRAAAAASAGQEKKKLKKASGWGGRRVGAGRKPSGKDAGVSHTPRVHAARYPALVTMRTETDVPSLKDKARRKVVEAALAASFTTSPHAGIVRVLAYAVDKDGVRLLVEAKDADAIATAMRVVGISVARQVNGNVGRAGKFWRDRYSTTDLTSDADARAAVGTMETAASSKEAAAWLTSPRTSVASAVMR